MKRLDVKLFLLPEKWKWIILFGVLPILGIPQIWIGLAREEPTLSLILTPVYAIMYMSWIFIWKYYCWDKYIRLLNGRIYNRKAYWKNAMDKIKDDVTYGEIKHSDIRTTHRFFDAYIDKCEKCGFKPHEGNNIENNKCPMCNHIHNNFQQVKHGEPCKRHRACYAHKTHPCEGCGRTNMEGEAWIIAIPL